MSVRQRTRGLAGTGCNGRWSEECADETLDRLAARLDEGVAVEDLPRAARCIARLALPYPPSTPGRIGSNIRELRGLSVRSRNDATLTSISA